MEAVNKVDNVPHSMGASKKLNMDNKCNSLVN